jgi:hypothetical protein
MSGIHRYSDGRIKVYTTLGANGWESHERGDLAFPCYTRGEEVIELDPGNVAFYSLGDRRITNGTWESIVERFAAAKGDTKEEVEEVIRSLEATLADPEYHPIPDAIEMLQRYANTLEG